MSDEVSQFLEQVERLRGQQIEEDEVRARELEEYLAAKRQRQARREERARSISPQKPTPANTPPPRSTQANRRSVHLSEATKLESPATYATDYREVSVDLEADTSADISRDSMAYASSDSPTKENESPLDAENKRHGGVTPLARSSTLSWQRRPASRAGSRPLSMVAAQNATQRSLAGSQEPSPAPEESLSKENIALALGSKDPSWFRQTPDRGVGNAAYRRTQVEDEDRLDMSSVKAQLPGMTGATKPQSDSPPASSTFSIQGKLASPLPLNPPPETLDRADHDDLISKSTAAPLSGQTSPARSISPTKGMGGFVQSAMLKRSDSVKRWSVTSPPGLARADSVASNRNARHERTPSHVDSKPQGNTRDGVITPQEQHRNESESDQTPKAIRTSIDTSIRQDEDDSALSVSPSKTMDPRRWSPTKSSWLESALNKPESPKLQAKPTNSSQPAWMVELNKTKAERTGASNDSPRVGQTAHKHQVSIGGLMRSAPMGSSSKPNTTGLGGIYSPPLGGNRPLPNHATKPSFPKSNSDLSSFTEDKSPTQKLDAKEASKDAGPDLSTTPYPVEEPPIEPHEDSQLQDKAESHFAKELAAANRPPPSVSANARKPEPEFKNVFGNLRKTKTQNYVAPDELKSTVLRGKAGLAVTGGPKKTERVDEFKEAILKKKEDFKKAQADGTNIVRAPAITTSASIPEGLAKRNELGKSRTGSVPNISSNTGAPISVKKPDSPKPTPGPKRIPSDSTARPKSRASEPVPSPGMDRIKRVSTEPANPLQAPRGLASPKLGNNYSSSPKLSGIKPNGDKLGGGFNSALAGMLARGPPPLVNDKQGSPKPGSSSEPAKPTESTEPTAAGPQLTHMTKGRARGPRRKVPTSSGPSVVIISTTDSIPTKVTMEAIGELVSKPPQRALPDPGPKSPLSKPLSSLPPRTPPSERIVPRSADKPAPLSIRQSVSAQAASLAKESNIATEVQGKSAIRDLPSQRGRQPPPESQPVQLPTHNKAPLFMKPNKTGDATGSQPTSPSRLNVKRMSRFLDEESDKPSSGSFETAVQPLFQGHQRSKSRSPEKRVDDPWQAVLPQSPTKVDREPVASVRSARTMFGDAAPPPLQLPSVTQQSSFDRTFGRPETPRPQRPLPLAPNDASMSPAPLESPVRSPRKQANEISVLLTDFFGSERPHKEYNIDPAEILMNRPQPAGKVTAVEVQACLIDGNGKKSAVPAHYERVLFEREMYLCAHEFTNAAGWKKSEMYFWVGDEVAESVADDAMLFAAKEAKLMGGKLLRISQGRETAEFIQALGGVAIIRRGSSNKYDSLAPHMLCGRRHLGQVVFDEVDLTTTSLCAGFTFLITEGGKCYLWKGKGSDAEEVSAARLVGMETALNGELVEYEEGREPESFWKILGGGLKPHSADHWRLKPNYGKYCSRLFCSDSNSRQQIFEISPFRQVDLSPTSIYIFDAFFEMYIIVGSRAQAQYASFRNALNFAQEYAILASSMEDRPFVPICTVVLEGIPRDLKSVFRKWRDSASPTITNPPGGGTGIRRGRSLRVVPLTQALQALNE